MARLRNQMKDPRMSLDIRDYIFNDIEKILMDYHAEASVVAGLKPLNKATQQILAFFESQTDKVTRFEVIDHRTRLGSGVNGRVLVIDPRSPQELPTKVKLSYQDDGKTLKVFLTDRKAIRGAGK